MHLEIGAAFIVADSNSDPFLEVVQIIGRPIFWVMDVVECEVDYFH